LIVDSIFSNELYQWDISSEPIQQSVSSLFVSPLP
jgi:hypothetical protein